MRYKLTGLASMLFGRCRKTPVATQDTYSQRSITMCLPPQITTSRPRHNAMLPALRRFLIARLWGVISLTLCGNAVFAAPPLAMGVAMVPHSLTVFVAEHEGYFAQEISQLKLVDCFPGAKCLNMLLAGSVQFATVADTPIVRASFVRSDFVVLTTIASSNNDIHVAGAKSAGITKLKNLVGKKIGLIKGSSADYFLDTVLLFDGIDPARVEKLDIPADDISEALRQHKIDAFVLFDPSLSKALNALGDSVAVLPTPPIYLATFNLVAARSLVGKNDADMVKVMRALDRAQLFIKQQPEAAQRILRKRLNMAPLVGKSLNVQMDYQLSMDQTFIKTLEGQARWLGQQKEVVGIRPANYLDFVYLPPLLQVRPKAVTVVK